MNFKITRRHLLAGSGGFLALPLLESLGGRNAMAALTKDPRRLVMIHFPSGTVTRSATPTWFSAPDGPLTASNAPIPLQPFTANLGDITLLKYLTQSARDQTLKNGAGGHGGSKPCFFTGQVPANLTSNASGIPGDSFDVMYGKTTPNRRSIYLGNSLQGSGDGIAYAYELSHKDGQKVVPEINPVSFYNTYFNGLTRSTAVAPPSDYTRNPTILDIPTAATARLRAQLGKADRVRLDSYLASLSDLKASLGAQPAVATCTPPGMPNVNASTTNHNGLKGMAYFARMTAFNSLIATGFQCDLFRSVAISFGSEGNYTTYDGAYPAALNYNGATLTIQYDHSVSHHSPISGEAGTYGYEPNMTRDRMHVYLVVDLINKLKAITDPSGSAVLDNTIIMAGFSVDDGQHNSGPSLGTPLLVAGGKNFMTPGRTFDASNYDLNDLYFTFSRLLGMGLTSFHPIAQTVKPYGKATGRMSGSTVVPL
ncbi:MAG: DUF1552 domain-containing protein [Myxococcota bacterium]|nr:DUF1552 domain-containing protein [Myxococcota bacterium]